MVMKLGAKELRITKPTKEQWETIERKPIYIVLDNVLDTYNIGSIFRLADAVAAREIILCGGTETPPNSRVHKAAVGTEEWVPWRYTLKTQDVLKSLKAQIPSLKIIAVEQDPRAIALGRLSDFGGQPMALVVGHETEGISRQVLEIADVIVEIPMWGVNKSLNVVVSTGIVLYKVLGLS